MTDSEEMQQHLFGAATFTDAATFSACLAYRYSLSRQWGDDGSVCWIMLNPSTATASVDDPTIRRCVGFSRAWGYGALEVVNLYALRSTDPAGLWKSTDPVGPQNDAAILRATQRASLVVCAWGANAKPARVAQVRELLMETPLHHLGRTKAGMPRHPLYLRADSIRQAWEESE